MKTAVIYWSGTGNTEIMANLIGEGITSTGNEATVMSVSQCSSDIMDNFDRFAFGCPAMGDEELEDSEFLPFFEGIEKKLAGRKVALFGSYGWGEGQWMASWETRVVADGANLWGKGLIVQETPDDQGKQACQDFGVKFASY